MRKLVAILIIALISLIICSAPLSAQLKVRDLKSHFMQDFAWMRLAEIVPKVTDRVILPIGTVESHGVCAIGTDNYIPQNLAEQIWDKCNALADILRAHGPFEPHRLSLDEMEYTTLPSVEIQLRSRWGPIPE